MQNSSRMLLNRILSFQVKQNQQEEEAKMKRPLPRRNAETHHHYKYPTYSTYKSRMIWAVCLLVCCLPTSSLAFQSGGSLKPQPLTLHARQSSANPRTSCRQVLHVARQQRSNPKSRGNGPNRRFNKSNNNKQLSLRNHCFEADHSYGTVVVIL